MHFIALKQKNNYIVKVLLLLLSYFLYLIFTLNPIVFVNGRARIFLAPGRKVP